MFSLSEGQRQQPPKHTAISTAEGQQQSAPTAVALAAETPEAAAVTGIHRCVVKGYGGSSRVVSGRGIGGGTCSSAGDRRYCYPRCVGRREARAPASADGTAALTTAPATGGTSPSAASAGGAPASSAVSAPSAEISAAEPATSGTVP